MGPVIPETWLGNTSVLLKKWTSVWAGMQGNIYAYEALGGNDKLQLSCNYYPTSKPILFKGKYWQIWGKKIMCSAACSAVFPSVTSHVDL